MVKGTDIFEGAGIGNLKYQQAMDITSAFLEWYKGWLEEHEPQATNSINACQAIMDDIGGTDFDETMTAGDEEE